MILSLFSEQILSAEQLLKQDDHEKRRYDVYISSNHNSCYRSIQDIFELYIPFIQIVSAANKRTFRSRLAKEPTLKKMLDLISSQDMIKTIRSIADEDQGSDQAVNLPDVEEIVDIIGTALNEYVYEPYILLEKRIIHSVLGIKDGTDTEMQMKGGSVMGSQFLYSTHNKQHSLKPNQSEISPEDPNSRAISEGEIVLETINKGVSQNHFNTETDPNNTLESEEKDFNDLIQLAKERISSWTLITTNRDKVSDPSQPTVDIYRCTSHQDSQLQGEGMVQTRAVILLPGISQETLKRALLEPELRNSWDSLVLNFQSHTLPSGNPVSTQRDLVYYVVKTPPGISNREFLLQRKIKTMKKGPGVEEVQTLIYYSSLREGSEIYNNNLNRFNIQENAIRCETLYSGYVIEENRPSTGTTVPGEDIQTDLCTRLIIVSYNDMKGTISKTIFDMIAQKAPFQWTTNLMNFCKKLQLQPAQQSIEGTDAHILKTLSD
ncbi:hypothetical protein FGO68_gene465 [Halteria grandinella]|uniref:START domain-containing protein n=1 Tax=Halteria grandinella TaxID=5974 RepID=A0A8J8P296_HALGN|nr:hypothetical protein FGO68_gene465 [Halteria grandinella]